MASNLSTTLSALAVTGAVVIGGAITATSFTGTTVTGTVLKATSSFTGATMTISDTTGSGNINVYGPDGGGVCFFDSDAAGWTVCSFLNGVQACSIAAAGYCPRF